MQHQSAQALSAPMTSCQHWAPTWVPQTWGLLLLQLAAQKPGSLPRQTCIDKPFTMSAQM